MDNVLFYGQGDDASRRQVRSAAAQHSHRVGPRKPKKSLRGGNEAAPVRRRAAHQKSTSTASSSEDAAGETASTQSAASPGPGPIPTAYRGSGATVTPPVAQQAVQRSFEQSQPTSWSPSYGTRTPETAASSPQYQYQQVTPPASGSTPHRRLPQYSWTEYPRYGMSSSQPQSLQMFAGAAEERQYTGQTTDRPRPQLPPPPTSGPPTAMHPYFTSGPP